MWDVGTLARSTSWRLRSCWAWGLGTDPFLKFMRMPDNQQTAHLEAVTSAGDDDASAEATTGLMHSLFANPSAVAGMQQLLDPDQLAAHQQVAVLAQRHLEEYDARCGPETNEAATPGPGAAASAGVCNLDTLRGHGAKWGGQLEGR